MKRYDWRIVGAGFVGATLAERIATELDQKVLLIDRRDHVGGNAYDQMNEHGHLVHRYGPHIFHTNAPIVSAYLTQFTEWIHYEHKVQGLINDRLIPVPFNLTSIDILFPRAQAAALKQRLIDLYGLDQNISILKLKKSSDPMIAELAGFIYDNVFDGYTRKQWGVGPQDLSPSVTERVPVRVGYDDRYFQDQFQHMPRDGYSALFDRMLRQPNIDITLDTNITAAELIDSGSRIVYTGSIDEFFDYCYGELEYRSLQFDFQTYRQRTHQPVAQINYPVSGRHTRITEFCHLTSRFGASTTVAIEYPEPYVVGKNIPYYPVPRDRNKDLYHRYRTLAANLAPQVLFAGRLADYQYYNMDQAVARALSMFERDIAN